MSGCDYLESIKGIGFKKAYKYVTQYQGDLDLILAKLRAESYQVPADYIQRFNKAFLTF